jgi:hypothetical protein
VTTVFIIEWPGCECGGACDVAFSTQEAAQTWVAEQEDAATHPKTVDYYEIKEVELQ